MILQFNWKSWNDYIRKDLSWKCIWATPPDLLRFIIGSTFNTLPSPNNRVRWRISDEDKCSLCGIGPCTVSHILSGCAFSLARASGRYSFRHDSVVKGLVEELLDQIRIKKKSFKKDPCLKVQFVKACATQKKSRKKSYLGLLDMANDWILHCDLGGDLDQRLRVRLFWSFLSPKVPCTCNLLTALSFSIPVYNVAKIGPLLNPPSQALL